jgi:Gpi18-like mannosyltransferase
LGLILIAITARVLPGPRTIDDSIITFRYARNILTGNGFVYNPGERVLGTTTPFYKILLTLVGIFAGGKEAPFLVIALVINAIADTVTCWPLYKLGKKLGSHLAGFGAAAVWSIAPFSVTFAIGGLETSLYILLLVGTTYVYLNHKITQTAFLAALTLLTRPDSLFLLLPLGIG